MRYFIIVLLPLILSSCGSYNSKFICNEAKGKHCVMMSEINKKIDVDLNNICQK